MTLTRLSYVHFCMIWDTKWLWLLNYLPFHDTCLYVCHSLQAIKEAQKTLDKALDIQDGNEQDQEKQGKYN
jgi:hypothetical protein